MKTRLFIHDRPGAISAQHFGDWALVYTGDIHADVASFNAERGEYPYLRAILCYAESRRINVPIRPDDIMQSLKPGEFLHDEEDPSTWDESTRRSRCQTGFAQALAAMTCSPRLTGEEKLAVVALVREHGVTRSDFWTLDERPGEVGYEIDGKEWHHKLRQVRNDPAAELFAVWGS